MRATVAVLIALAVLTSVTSCGASPGPPTPVTAPVVLGSVGHDTSAFTQGLELAPGGGALYEGTGLRGRSQLRELDPATGALRRSVPLPQDWFGEGIAIVGDRIWQLTWTDGVALEWDRTTFRLLRTVPLDGEGWGLCLDGNRLARSDGSSRLRFHDPSTFAETGSVDVTLDGSPVDDLNELECVNGQVWANVWQTDRLVRIDPASGRVTAVVDAPDLLTPAQRSGADVLNGIAHLGGDEYLLTGKLWPAMFRVRLPG